MPLPASHERSLEETVEEYRVMADLLSREELKRALGELYDDPEARRRAVDDPTRYLEEQGLQLPDGVTPELYTSGDRWFIGFCRKRGTLLCCSGYWSDEGFGWRRCRETEP